MKLTVDASIVVKWYVAETHSEDARLLLSHRLERFAPEFLLVEFANTVWKKARRGEIADPYPYLGEIPALGEAIDLLPDADLVERAARLASELDHPVYDCLYLACAEATGSALITADRSFANKAAVGPPDVRYIGEPDVAEEIDSAASAPVISRERLEELVVAHDLLEETDEHVRSALYKGKIDLAVMSPEDQERVLDSPAGRRLAGIFRTLNEDERIDLLALGWLGQGNLGVEWRPVFERACEMIDLYAEADWRYVLGLGAFWCAGYQRLTGTFL